MQNWMLALVIPLGQLSACSRATPQPCAPAIAVPARACRSAALAFRPRPSVPYRATTEQNGQRYQSTITFTRDGQGWTATESDFLVIGGLARPIDLAGAKLVWRLDARGIPTGAPATTANPGASYLPNVTITALRPLGLTGASTCVGDEGSSAWTDEQGRLRTFRFRVVAEGEREVRVHVIGAVTTAVNQWRSEGELSISRSDGFTIEGRLHVSGPGAPRINDFDRQIAVTATMAN